MFITLGGEVVTMDELRDRFEKGNAPVEGVFPAPYLAHERGTGLGPAAGHDTHDAAAGFAVQTRSSCLFKACPTRPGTLGPSPPWVAAGPPASPAKLPMWSCDRSEGSTTGPPSEPGSLLGTTDEFESEENSASDRSNASLHRLNLQEMALAARRRHFVTPGRRRFSLRTVHSQRASPAPTPRHLTDAEDGDGDLAFHEADSAWETCTEAGGAESDIEEQHLEEERKESAGSFCRALTAPAELQVEACSSSLAAESCAQQDAKLLSPGSQASRSSSAIETTEQQSTKAPSMASTPEKTEPAPGNCEAGERDEHKEIEERFSIDEEDEEFDDEFFDCAEGELASRKRRCPRQLVPSLLEDTSSRLLWEVEQARAKLKNPLTRPRSHNGVMGQNQVLSEVAHVRATLRPSPGPRKSWAPPTEESTTTSACSGFERLQGKFVSRKSSLEGFINAKMTHSEAQQ